MTCQETDNPTAVTRGSGSSIGRPSNALWGYRGAGRPAGRCGGGAVVCLKDAAPPLYGDAETDRRAGGSTHDGDGYVQGGPPSSPLAFQKARLPFNSGNRTPSGSRNRPGAPLIGSRCLLEISAVLITSMDALANLMSSTVGRGVAT